MDINIIGVNGDVELAKSELGGLIVGWSTSLVGNIDESINTSFVDFDVSLTRGSDEKVGEGEVGGNMSCVVHSFELKPVVVCNKIEADGG